MKIMCALLAFVLLMSAPFAMDLSSIIKVKDRLRVELWVDGVPEFSAKKQMESAPTVKPLPEELVRALQKMPL